MVGVAGPRDARRGPVPDSQTLISQDSGCGGQLCHFARLCAAGSDRPKSSDANEEPETAVEERNRGQIGAQIARIKLARARTLPERSILSGTAGILQDRAIAAIAAIAASRHRAWCHLRRAAPTAKRRDPAILRRVGPLEEHHPTVSGWSGWPADERPSPATKRRDRSTG